MESNRNQWGFYGRRSELADIDAVLASGRWFFCSLSGRRRIGKSSLILRALHRHPQTAHFYFQVPDADERGVVQVFQDSLEDLDVDPLRAREYRTFDDMTRAIDRLCRAGLVVVLDEFQYFHRAALSRFTSLLQARVDLLRDSQVGGLFVLGSVHTEMNALLEDRSAALFNRLSHRVDVGHWDLETLFEVCGLYGVDEPGQQLFLWSLFEGVPKYYRDACEQGLLAPLQDYRRDTLRRLFFEGPSPLRDEASVGFLRELRGASETLLRLVARLGPVPLGTLRDEYGRAGPFPEKQFGGNLAALVDRYRMVERLQPIFADPRGRKARYAITDNFLASWHAALDRALAVARMRPMGEAVARADVLLENHEGHCFEKMVRLAIEECSRKGVGDLPVSELVRGYWNKPDGSDIEIDVVVLDEPGRRVSFGSCKRDASAHRAEELDRFEGHIGRFLGTKDGRRLLGWRADRVLFAPSFPGEQRSHLGKRGFRCIDLRDFRRWLHRDEPVQRGLFDPGR